MELIAEPNYAYAGEACYVCLSGDALVDTGAVIVGEGELGICVKCVREMADAAGLKVTAPKAQA